MKGVNLRKCNLSDTSFKRTNLEDAKLCGANLQNANFNYAMLRNTSFKGTKNIDKKTLLIGKIVSKDAKNLNLQGVNLSRADLSGANLSGCDLRGVNFSYCYFRGVNFSNANLSDGNFSYTSFAGGNFENANLSNTKLSTVYLSHANLSQANLNNIYLLGVNLKRANLENSSLKNATLIDVNLEEANLTNANLTQTSFTGVRFYQANFKNVIRDSYAIFYNSADNPNLELLKQIREISKDLSYVSASDYPYQIFLWETTYLGEMNWEKLFLIFGHLREIDSQEFIKGNLDNLDWLQESNCYYLDHYYEYNIIGELSYYSYLDYYHNDFRQQQVITLFRNLLDEINTYLTNIKVLRLMGQLYVVVAKTTSGEWVGISTPVDTYAFGSSPLFRCRDSAITKPKNQELIKALENTIININFSSQYLKKGFIWEIAESKTSVVHNILDRMEVASINEVELIFDNLIDDGEDYIETHMNLQQIDNFVFSHLSNLRQYYVGDRDYRKYFVGQTNDKDWIIIQTRGA